MYRPYHEKKTMLANLADVKQELSSIYKYCGSVPTVNDLPDTENQPGDVYNVEETDMNYAYVKYDEVQQKHIWDPLGPSLQGYLTKTEAEETYSTIETVNEHIEDTSNPHGVTKEQVGLGSVDNTADLDKPISTATQTALDGKVSVDHTGNVTIKGVFLNGLPDQSLNSYGNYSHAEGYSSKAYGQYSHAEGHTTRTASQASYAHAEGRETRAGGEYSHVDGYKAVSAEGASGTSQVVNPHNYAWVWNGDNSIADFYFSHGPGTFNINPKPEQGSTDPTTGLWIGGKKLSEILAGLTVEIADPTTALISDEGKAADAYKTKLALDGKVDVNHTGDVSITGKLTVTGSNKSIIFDGEKIYRQNGSNPSKAYLFPDNGGKLALQSEIPTVPSLPLSVANGGTGATTAEDARANLGAVNKSGDTMTGALTVPTLTVGSRQEGSTVGANSVSEGYDNVASEECSHAEGQNSTASEYCSHAEGCGSTASGYVSHAEGQSATASGYTSHAEGYGSTASGVTSHAEGSSTASGDHSHAEGSSTASGDQSHAEGASNTASGSQSHAEGAYTTASGDLSHAEGAYTTAQNNSEHAQGAYNASHTVANSSFGNSGNTLSSIGFGTALNNRKNAVETMQDGKIFIYGLGGYDGTNPTGNGVKDLVSAFNGKVGTMESVTWAQLKAKRDGGTLVPGQQYRITDYVAKTTQADTQSANHPFDIIVTADTDNKLNEVARATLHEGDTYFANCKPEAWKVWYCLDNDYNRFAWVESCIVCNGTKFLRYAEEDSPGSAYPYCWKRDTFKRYTSTETPTAGSYAYTQPTGVSMVDIGSVNLLVNGKGVIYRLIDEFGNDCPYDFKGIQFQRWSVTNITSPRMDSDSLTALKNELVYGNNVGHFSFVPYNLDDEGSTALIVNSENSDFYFTFSDNGTDASLSSLKLVYGNRIGALFSDSTGKRRLNNIVFLSGNSFLNTFDNNCTNFTIGGDCNRSHFETGCSQNILARHQQRNTFGTNCYLNIIGDSYSIIMSSDCSCNVLSAGCQLISFGTACRDNVLGEMCRNISFGIECHENSLGNRCLYDSFGNDCQYNTFGLGNATKPSYWYVIVENGVRYVDLNCTSGSLGPNAPYKNVKVSQGVSGTGSQRKIIEDQNNNQSYQTIYQTTGSNVISV